MSSTRTRSNPLAKLLSKHRDEQSRSMTKSVSTSTSTVCKNGLCEETSIKQYVDKSGKPVTKKETRQFQQEKIPSLFDSFIPGQLLHSRPAYSRNLSRAVQPIIDFEFPRSRRQHICNCPYCMM
jgi:hypothetical protein